MSAHGLQENEITSFTPHLHLLYYFLSMSQTYNIDHLFPGVHLKTLEVYALIFKRIGTDRLARDLAIYSMGLFPLMGHSAMNVKPVLLDMFEK